jgi:hypothetical protein
MGEAKRRAASDPNFGKPKPPRRGLIVSAPFEIKGSSLTVRSFNLDPQELRFSLLLFDQIVWPRMPIPPMPPPPPGGYPEQAAMISTSHSRDEEFLEWAGFLTRPNYTFIGDLAQGVAKMQIQAFADHDAREPGQWSLAQGENSFFLHDKLLEPDAGALLELQRAIPIPDKDVPLNEVLEFKRRRNDELQRLRAALDGFLETINQAEDKEAELQKHIATIDAACADALRVSHEWQFPVRLTNFKTSFDLRPFVTAAGGVAAYGVGIERGLPASAAILAGIGGAVLATAPALKLAGDFGWRGLKRRLGPYRYVYQFHNELF